MTTIHKVKVTVDSVTKGKCPRGFKESDSWMIQDNKTPGGMCAMSYHTFVPLIEAFMFGGEFPYGDNKDVVYMRCPDSKRELVYEIRKLD